MEIKVLLIQIMEHLNTVGSKVFIESIDEQSGIISLSNHIQFYIGELNDPKDIEEYI